MRRSSYRRAATRRGPDRRVIAAVAVLVVGGGVVGITQISNADETKVAACAAATPSPANAKAATDPRVGTYTDKDGDVQHKGDGQLAKGEQKPAPEPAGECKDGNTIKKTVNGLEITTDTCEDSKLTPHDGFQNGDRCVSTEFGEVGEAAKNPTLLITDFPREVEVGQPFTLKVSTRNLVRDRFLAAGQGGYYVESSVLTAEGLVRGHFHTACRMLASTSEAVDPAPVPAFFVATEDKKGGAQPDTVTIQVPGLPQAGIAQCASWAGDGSHRVPMMQRANQTPAIDAVRVTVRGGNGDNGGGGDNGGNQGGGQGDNGGNQGGGQDQPTTPPADNGGGQGDNGNGQGDNGGNQGGNTGGNQGGGNGDGQNDGGATPGATVTPRTETGTTPPKSPTVTLPPRNSGGSGQDEDTPATAKPVRTTTAPAEENADAGSDSDDSPAQTVTGRTAKPKPTTSTKAAVAADTDDGAPDEPAAAQDTEVADVQADGGNRLALTGANVMTVSLGGAVLILAGLLVLSATRRRRAEADQD
ncbi:hypothetical protein COUCH_20255 [Couchioplanes caeruleus]|uniref:hypothetical protein n=1 Tax=Couchioplanes caeruleus TaxID=56438 RepID=UPI0020BFE2BE|nr:hypothetical protein [Couchioplanes caeruleus]UQU61399.1 hypothetical protein COUCH_20255 [Couchioplanes caeruleus]